MSLLSTLPPNGWSIPLNTEQVLWAYRLTNRGPTLLPNKFLAGVLEDTRRYMESPGVLEVIWITFLYFTKYRLHLVLGIHDSRHCFPNTLHSYLYHSVQQGTKFLSFLKKINSKSPGPITDAKSILRYICWEWNDKVFSRGALISKTWWSRLVILFTYKDRFLDFWAILWLFSSNLSKSANLTYMGVKNAEYNADWESVAENFFKSLPVKKWGGQEL